MSEELQKKVDRAIKLIQSASKIAAENGCPEIEVAYSSGKDSDVILELTKMAGVPYRAIYKNTTIDACGAISHAQKMGAEILRPQKSFFELVAEMGFPNRFTRFCCKYLKEYKVLDYAVLGIRRSESRKRSEIYKEPERCRVYSKKEKVRQYFPILDWTDEDVLQFIKEHDIKCAPVYYDEQGNFHVERRLGCLCCPLMSKSKRIEEFKAYPNMVKAYINAWKKYITNHPNRKEAQIYKNDIYAKFVRDVFFCDNSQGWDEINSEYALIPPTNYKEFLEDYFNIKFKD